MEYQDAIDRLQVIADAAYDRYPNRGSFADFFAVLNDVERKVVNIGKLSQQVNNGGFAQWIDNGYATRIPELLAALREVGTPAALEAIAVVGYVAPHADEYYRQTSPGAMWSHYELPDLDHLDSRFYTVDEQLMIDVAQKFATQE